MDYREGPNPAIDDFTAAAEWELTVRRTRYDVPLA
jgi:hypothetical protein